MKHRVRIREGVGSPHGAGLRWLDALDGDEDLSRGRRRDDESQCFPQLGIFSLRLFQEGSGGLLKRRR